MKKFLLVLFSVLSFGLIVSCNPTTGNQENAAEPENPTNPENPENPDAKEDVDVSGCYLEESTGSYYILEKSDSDFRKGTIKVSGENDIEFLGSNHHVTYKVSGTYELKNGSVVIALDDNITVSMDGDSGNFTIQQLQALDPTLKLPEVKKGTYSLANNILTVTDTSGETPVSYALVKQPLNGDYELIFAPLLSLYTDNFKNLKYNFKECGVVTASYTRKDSNCVLKGNWKVSSDNKLTVKFTEGTKDGEAIADADINGVPGNSGLNDYLGTNNFDCGIYNKVFYAKNSSGKIAFIYQTTDNSYTTPTATQVAGSWIAVYGSSNGLYNDPTDFNADGSFKDEQSLSSNKGTWNLSGTNINVEITETKLSNSEDWTSISSSYVYSAKTDGDMLVLTKNASNTTIVKYCFKK